MDRLANPIKRALAATGIDPEQRPTGLLSNTEVAEACKTCGGAQYIRGPVTDPIDPRFGEIEPCPECWEHEIGTRRSQRLLGSSGLADFRDERFGNRNPRPGQEVLFQAAQAFAQEPSGWLWIEGSYGSGKTLAAKMIANEVLDRGQPVYFRVVSALLRDIRRTFDPDSDVTEQVVWDAVLNVYLLVLDDYGRQNPTRWTHEHLFELLDYRHAHRLATVVTTNQSVNDLDGAIASRVRDDSVVNIIRVNGTDHRS